MITIRNYSKADWPEIESWWKVSGETPPLPTMMPPESSFVAELEGKPALAVAIYLTNTPELAYVENFIGNPAMKGSDRSMGASLLADHISNFARSRGYKRLLCMTEKQALKGRYIQLGFQPTLGGVTTFVRNT
jgi:hypothetical protein